MGNVSGARVPYVLFIGRRVRAILQPCGSRSAMKRTAQVGNVDVISYRETGSAK
jgi:hypothetical protein